MKTSQTHKNKLRKKISESPAAFLKLINLGGRCGACKKIPKYPACNYDGGRDVDGFSQLAACSPERMETRSSREASDCFN